jgi:hypothetical protein
VDREFVHGRISDADPVLVARVVQVGIRNPSPKRTYGNGFEARHSRRLLAPAKSLS